MKKTSKIVSIILICSMCFTLFGGVTVFSDSVLSISSGMPSLGGSGSYTRTIYNSANCYGYETSTDDIVHKWVGKEECTYAYYNFEANESSASDINAHKYLVLNYNFITENIDSIHLETASSKKVSSKITSDNWKSDKWNSVVFVCTIDQTNQDKNVKLTDITYYINGADGVSLGASENPYNVSSATADTIRFRFKFNFTKQPKNTTVYIGQHNIYATDTLPTISMPVFDASVKADYVNGKVYLPKNAKVQDIAVYDECELSVFAQGDYTKKRELGETVEYGDKIVLKAQNKALSYFDVYIDGIDYRILDDNGDSFSDKGVASSLIDEYKGKQKDDDATLLDGGDTASSITLPLENEQAPQDYNYYVYDLMFSPENKDFNIALGDLEIKSGLGINKWNTLRFIYNLSDNNVTIYINGVANEAQIYEALPQNLILSFKGKAAVDKVYSYYSKNLPDEQTVAKVSGATCYKNVIYVDDFKVSSLSAVDGVINVYSDRSISAKLKDDDIITTGNVVVLESKDGVFNYLNAVNKETWATSEADIVVKFVFSSEESALKFSGMVPTETNETIKFVATDEKSNTKIEKEIVCNDDGSINYTLPLTTNEIGKRYNYTLTTDAVSVSGVLGLFTKQTLQNIVDKINDKSTSEQISDYLSDIHLNISVDDADVLKDFSYIGALIYEGKQKNLYTLDTFTKTYTVAQALSYVKNGKITFEKFLIDYNKYFDENYYEIFKELNSDKKEIMENLYKSGLVFSDFGERFNESLWICDYQLSESSDELQSLTIAKFKETNDIPTKYTNSLNEYQKLEIFDLMFPTRKEAVDIAGVLKLFKEKVSGYIIDDGGSSSSGGSSSRGGGSFINDKITVIVPTEETNSSNLPSQNTKSDISGHWAEDTIKSLSEKGIMTGYENGDFKPDNNISRAEFTKLIVVMLSLDESYDFEFSDVKADKWYAGFIGAAYKNNLISGFDSKFNPDSNITREDAVTIIYRVLESIGTEIKEKEVTFDDKDDISQYALEKVGALSNLGIIKGDNNAFRPKSNITRAETAAILYRIISYTSLEQD